LNHLSRRGAFRALNKYYTGKETIPLKTKVPPLLTDCAHYLASSRRIPVKVIVYADGSVELFIIKS